jgi:hypothetical protein
MTSRDDTITTTYDPDACRLVLISKAVKGQRYRGVPGSRCQDCTLYPRKLFRRRQAHFAHLPTSPYCDPSKRGESPEHRAAKNEWADFLEDQLSGCFVCIQDGRAQYPDHEHPSAYMNREVIDAPPKLRGVIWPCKECAQPHHFDLLEKADTVRREWPNTGRTTQVDIALFGDVEIPEAIIEIKRTNLSDRSLEYANALQIPWFVLDTSQWDKTRPMDLFASVRPLNDWPDLQQDPPRNFEIVRHTVSRDGVDAMTFRWYFDDAGRLTASLDILSHEVVETPSTPKPSIGNYIYASQTNFTCEMARDTILGKTVISS